MKYMRQNAEGRNVAFREGQGQAGCKEEHQLYKEGQLSKVNSRPAHLKAGAGHKAPGLCAHGTLLRD